MDSNGFNVSDAFAEESDISEASIIFFSLLRAIKSMDENDVRWKIINMLDGYRVVS